MRTIDEVFAECKALSNEEFETLLCGLLTEQKERQDRDRKQAWNKVCEVIRHFTANYGAIRVIDSEDDKEITLCFGDYSFGNFGDIWVGV